MKLISVNTTSDDASTTSDITESVEAEAADHMLSVDEFGKIIKLTGANKDIYEAVAFLFQPTSGLLELGLNSWLLESKLGIRDDNSVVSGEMGDLLTALQNGGLDTITNVEAVRDSSEDGTWVMKFTVIGGDSFIIDPFVAASLR